jgi:hypothetical protein
MRGTEFARPLPCRRCATGLRAGERRVEGSRQWRAVERLIRLVVPYSSTLLFEDKGAIHGISANGAQLSEEWVNKTLNFCARPLIVTLTPLSRDKRDQPIVEERNRRPAIIGLVTTPETLPDDIAARGDETVRRLSRKFDLAAAFRYMRSRWTGLGRCFALHYYRRLYAYTTALACAISLFAIFTGPRVGDNEKPLTILTTPATAGEGSRSPAATTRRLPRRSRQTHRRQRRGAPG